MLDTIFSIIVVSMVLMAGINLLLITIERIRNMLQWKKYKGKYLIVKFNEDNKYIDAFSYVADMDGDGYCLVDDFKYIDKKCIFSNQWDAYKVLSNSKFRSKLFILKI